LKDQNPLQKALAVSASRLTVLFPRAGSRFLNVVVPHVLGNELLFAAAARRTRRALRGAAAFGRFLVIPDIHIGDAVMTLGALTAIRDFFPSAQVDYLVNRTAFPIIEGHPEATRILPFFNSGWRSSREMFKDLRDLVMKGRYDVCLNFCPYLKDKEIARPGQGILNIISDVPAIVFNERFPLQTNHFAYRMYRFTRDALALAARPVRGRRMPNLRLMLGDEAIEGARRFISESRPPADRPWIFHNPDAAIAYNRIPDIDQIKLIERLARGPVHLLIGAGHSAAGIGERLRAALPGDLFAKTTLVPASLPLEAYAALIDFCDVYVSGDTGPLHIGAARKFSRSGRFAFRNRTAVLSVFGATPARMSGYDSFRPGFLAANQDAPSWTVIAPSPCRNIVCVEKMLMTCPTVRCFEGLDVAALAGRIEAYLASAGSSKTSGR
jgi:ADP-heptose:LPS heptosyltransferase